MALTVRNVSKSFGTKLAVDAIHFEIPSPEIFGLIGTNGAGKTTTIRMILGVLEKDEGEIYGMDNPSGATGSGWGTCRKRGDCTPKSR